MITLKLLKESILLGKKSHRGYEDRRVIHTAVAQERRIESRKRRVPSKKLKAGESRRSKSGLTISKRMQPYSFYKQGFNSRDKI